MERTGAKIISGKHIPKTIDAIRIGERYLDPADVRLRFLDSAALGIAFTVIVILFTHLF